VGKKSETLIFPTIHEFNGKTKEFMKLVNAPSSKKAYETLLKELKCPPSEVGSKLRDRVWKGKTPRDILGELEPGLSPIYL